MMRKLGWVVALLGAGILTVAASIASSLPSEKPDFYLDQLNEWVLAAKARPFEEVRPSVDTELRPICRNYVLAEAGPAEAVDLLASARQGLDSRVEVCLRITVNRVAPQPESYRQARSDCWDPRSRPPLCIFHWRKSADDPLEYGLRETVLSLQPTRGIVPATVTIVGPEAFVRRITLLDAQAGACVVNTPRWAAPPFKVDWGDGVVEHMEFRKGCPQAIAHTYTTPGEYEVKASLLRTLPSDGWEVVWQGRATVQIHRP